MDNKVIDGFRGEYEYLANTYNSDITYDGMTYTNAEAAYWAQRVKDKRARNKYSRLSGNKARAKAMQAIPIEDWETTKNDIMMNILRVKFNKNSELGKKLIATNDAKIINTNTYRDDYYGVYMNKGKNILGKMLMKIRDEIK